MALTLEQVRNRSASRLVGLHPVVLSGAQALIDLSYAAGVPIVITQGLRTIAEQDALYAQGRTRPGSIVTNAKGGYSNHNFGVAIDFALLLPDGKNVSWDTLRDGDKDSLPDWSEVVDIAKSLGFAWGGDWRSFKDMPHFELTFGLTTSQYRAGARPSASVVNAALAKINRAREESEQMSAEDKKRLSTLESAVAQLANSRDVLKDQALQQAQEIKDLRQLVVTLTNDTPPVWAIDAIKALANTPSVLNGKPVIDTPNKATYTEARLITILHRLGLTARQEGGK